MGPSSGNWATSSGFGGPDVIREPMADIRDETTSHPTTMPTIIPAAVPIHRPNGFTTWNHEAALFLRRDPLR
ncbi:MAG: hypothetical protein JW719_04815 [Pirellulales bacterium]|nr:hypothetical protein [Pirellulales bacterium]